MGPHVVDGSSCEFWMILAPQLGHLVLAVAAICAAFAVRLSVRNGTNGGNGRSSSATGSGSGNPLGATKKGRRVVDG